MTGFSDFNKTALGYKYKIDGTFTSMSQLTTKITKNILYSDRAPGIVYTSD